METIAVVPGIKSSSPKLIAPRWHTVLLVALFLALALSGALFQREARSQPGGLQQQPSCCAAIPLPHRHGMGAFPLCVEGRLAPQRNEAARTDWWEMAEAPKMSRLMRASHWDYGRCG